MTAARFSGAQVCHFAGLTYRQLDYYDRTGLLSPSLAAANGSGTARRYSPADARTARRIAKLLDEGISLPQLRQFIVMLREAEGVVVVGRNDIEVVTLDEVPDAIRRMSPVVLVLSLMDEPDPEQWWGEDNTRRMDAARASYEGRRRR